MKRGGGSRPSPISGDAVVRGKSANDLEIRPLMASRVDDVKVVTRGSWGASCWDLYPRFNAKQQRERGIALQGAGTDARRRAVLATLARRRTHAPGLVAYRDSEPVGFISLGPRYDFARIEASRATPRVDDIAAWVIPCITVRRGFRGSGVAIAMIRAAVAYATKRGAPAVEAYPRKDNARINDDFAFFGTEAMFRKAGFRQIRGPLADLPKTWTPRVTMRFTTGARSGTRRQRAAATRKTRVRVRSGSA